MEQKKILHLTLKKKWFDMIRSGEKKEEYRECKDYWVKRLVGNQGQNFDYIVFRNGYNKNSPSFKIDCKGIIVGIGKKEWGAPDYKIFIIKLGNIIHEYQPTELETVDDDI